MKNKTNETPTHRKQKTHTERFYQMPLVGEFPKQNLSETKEAREIWRLFESQDI